VERRNGFFETSFMPGREFASPADFNAQFADWLDQANGRSVRTIKARRSIWSTPTGRRCCRCRRSHPGVGWFNQVRLGRDYYVRDRQQRLLRRPDRDRPAGRRGRRPERVRGPPRRAAWWPITPAYGPAAHDGHRPRPRRRRRQLREDSSQRPRTAATDDDLVRDLADYDRAFGLIDGDRRRSPDGHHEEPATDAVKQIPTSLRRLKAPRITEAAARLADQARDAGWTHEDYLAAVLEREVSARNASGAAQRIRAAGFGAAKRSRTSTSTPNPPSANKSRRWPPAGS
jgi:hypothetical protein